MSERSRDEMIVRAALSWVEDTRHGEQQRQRGLAALDAILGRVEIPPSAVVVPADALDKARALLQEVMIDVPTSRANVGEHARLQSLHRRVIAFLGLPDPGQHVLSHYWMKATSCESPTALGDCLATETSPDTMCERCAALAREAKP